MAYRKKDSAERLAELEAQEKQLRARINREKARIKTEERKKDTRRKIIAGALALEHKDEGFQAQLRKLIDEYVLRPEERALFDLEPLPDDTQTDDLNAAYQAAAAPAAPSVGGKKPNTENGDGIALKASRAPDCGDHPRLGMIAFQLVCVWTIIPDRTHERNAFMLGKLNRHVMPFDDTAFLAFLGKDRANLHWETELVFAVLVFSGDAGK